MVELEFEILSKRENPLLKRLEIEFKAIHPNEPTPTREKIREEIAKLVKTPIERVIIASASSEFGKTETRGYAKVYKSKKDAMGIEREYILVRNKLLERVVSEKKEEKIVPPKKESEEKKEEEQPPPKEKEKEGEKREGEAKETQSAPKIEEKEEKKKEGKEKGEGG